jgi:hypothetical protein
MTDVIDTPFVHLEIRDNILFGTYKKGLKINLEIAKKIVDARLAFTKGRDMRAVIYNQGVISMDKSARDFLASPEGTKGLSAAAMMLDSAFSSFLGNFYLSVNKPPMPVRIFTSTEAAVKWLKRFENQ